MLEIFIGRIKEQTSLKLMCICTSLLVMFIMVICAIENHKVKGNCKLTYQEKEVGDVKWNWEVQNKQEEVILYMRHKAPCCRIVDVRSLPIHKKSNGYTHRRGIEWELLNMKYHMLFCCFLDICILSLTGNEFSELNRPGTTYLRVFSSWDKSERILHFLFELYRWHCIFCLSWWNFDRSDS